MAVEIRKQQHKAGLLLDRVIPDTGSDATALPWSDCKQLQFDLADGMPGLMAGVGQSSIATVIFPAWPYLDGTSYRCRLQADFEGNERILSRDVLNRIAILFRGPEGEVIINP